MILVLIAVFLGLCSVIYYGEIFIKYLWKEYKKEGDE